MAIYVKPSGELVQLHDHLDRVRRLLRDIEALAAGSYPTSLELAEAPVLENWDLAANLSPCLIGRFSDHPSVRDGNFGLTSDLWIHAPTHGFARTLSRLYRLGPAASLGEPVQ